MPHKCTNCGRTFADGSKEMLSGCPDCGGNKFQFQPSRSSPSETKAPNSTATNDTAATHNSTSTDSQSEAGAVGRARNTVKGWVGSRSRSESTNSDSNQPTQPSREQRPSQSSRKQQPTHGESTQKRPAQNQSPTKQAAPAESTTKQTVPEQAAAEQAVDVEAESNEDQAQASARSEIVPEDELPDRPGADGTGTVIKPPEDNQPSLDELREELNSQFESIKVVEPGQYELNLMELYERDEYIIAMRENGRYVIQVPDSWTGAADS